MDHSTEVFLRIEAIFNEAIEAPVAARKALIAERCEGDPSLIAEVESLLRANETVEELTSGQLRERGESAEELADRRRIGPYELDRLLGRGGMGAVYLAHRADGQFEQQVAIKLIDLPLATDFFRERFRQERQILAGLQHPYIARLLDGGVTTEGDLYLAMEYVDGTPIHRFCEAKQLSIPRRLALFKRVCEAVQFAHQNLVVHRDLKPDNILVVEDGTPRLLDFGTAKLVSPSLEQQDGDLTRQGFQSYTPQYASPEQVLGNPITTASDTYSLGVLLYLLLTGSLPYALKELSMAEMVRVICTEPPRKPAAAVHSDRPLDADLEAILMKALRKEPQERYRTAEQMSADIQDYLSGRPVAARRGNLRYRATKFIRRNRLGIGAAILLAITLFAGIAGVLWQARVANRQRRMAEARSADLRELSNSLLSELDEAIKQLPGSTGVQKLLVTRVLEHLDRMAKDAQGDRQTQLDLVDAYTRLGNIQGNAYDQNLGDPAGALASLGKAQAIAAPLVAANSKDRDAMRALASVEQSRSEILWQTGKTPEAIVAMLQAVKSFDEVISDPHTSPAQIGDAAGAYSALGDEYGQPGAQSMGNSAEALRIYRKAIDLDNRSLSIDPNFLRARRGLAIMEMKIGSVEEETDPAQALKDYQIALERTDALPQTEQAGLNTVRLRSMLRRKEANTLEEIGRYTDAFSIYAQIADYNRKLSDQDLPDLRALVDLEVVLDDEAGAYDDAANPVLAAPSSNPEADRHKNLLAAKQLYGQTSTLFDQMLKLSPSNERWKILQADAEVKIGTLSHQLHEADSPASLTRKALGVLREAALKPDVLLSTLDSAGNAALQVEPAELRDPAFAIECAERAAGMSNRQTPSVLLSLAQAYRAIGETKKSRSIAQEGLALLFPDRPGEPESRIRKLLEFEIQH
jgi:tetratricopeptide (TPR) repeat protein